MAYANEHMLLTFGGTLADRDIWSCGFRVGTIQDGGDQDAEREAMEALAPRLGAAWSANPNPLLAAAKMTWLKFNRIGTDGKYVRQASNTFDYGTPAAPPDQGFTLPLQCSLVLTLHTPVNRGNAARGRIYLPAPKAGGNGDGTMTGAQTLTAANWGAALVNAVNGTPGVGEVLVCSPGGVRDPQGVNRTVTHVSVGNVIDTQRSRRSALVEARQEAPVFLGGVAPTP